MELTGRAYYNLLRGNWLEDSSLKVEEWQVEDYRALTSEEIFKRLKFLGVTLNKDSFVAYAEECDGPEELSELFFPDEKEAGVRERAYLFLFELWRRELPDRQTLSIFCDEFDRLIDLYDRNKLEDVTPLEEAVDDLEKILDESVDAGLDPKEAFALVGQFCAHDIESFLYDYFSEMISHSQELAASELIDGFYDYIEDSRWFDFLRSRLFALANINQSNDLLARLLESFQEQPDLDLLLEITTFLAHEGDPELFKEVVLLCLAELKTEEDFQDLLAIAADYHRCLDQETEEKLIETLFKKRSDRILDEPLDHADQDVNALRELLQN